MLTVTKKNSFRYASRRAYTLLEIICVLAILAALVALLFPALHLIRQRAQQSACADNLHALHLAMATYLSDYEGRFPPDTPSGRFGTSSAGPYWYDTLLPYLGHAPFPACPSTRPLPWSVPPGELRKVSGYAYNTNLARWSPALPAKDAFTKVGVSEADLAAPSDTVIFFDARPGINALGRPDTLTTLEGFWGLINPNTRRDFKKLPMGARRHSGGANYVFGDGHAQWLKPERLGEKDFTPAR